jgi:FHS family L-fucose permease-like MFS transporter
MSVSPSSPKVLLRTVYFIYFFCGLTLCLEGAFNPEFKDHFQLGYQQQMYTMLTKNLPFVLALVIGLFVTRIGYKNCLSVGLFLFAVGTLLLVPGLERGSYALVLVGFFIIGLGFNFQLVAGNPLLSHLGPAEGSSSRLNLGNALGAIAQILGPLVLATLIPATVTSVQAKLPYMKGLFTITGFLLLGVAVMTLLIRETGISPGQASTSSSERTSASPWAVWLRPKVLLGFVTIFLVLGAEAGLFGLFRNYLEDPAIAGLTSRQSQQLFTVYFAVFALGRLVGAAVQKIVKPAYTLAVNAVVAALLLLIMVSAKGPIAIVAAVAIGFFVSIFFPTLYSLAIEGMGDQTPQVSGLLTMGFLGCALLPVLQGRLADQFGLQRSYLMWLIPYLCALLYALNTHRFAKCNA